MGDNATSVDLYSRVFGSGGDGQGFITDQVTLLNDSPEAEKRAQEVMKNVAKEEGPRNAWAGPAREDAKYYDGHQWDDVDRMAMEQKKRPAITFNEIKPTIKAVSGLERLNRTDVRVVARAYDSDEQIEAMGDLASEALATSDDLCNGAEEMSRVAKRALITGMGWAEVKMDYTADINGRVMYERLDEFQMGWDSDNQQKENLEDTNYRFRKKPISRKEFEKRWRDKCDAIDSTTPEMPFGGTNKYELVTPYYSKANEDANPQVGAGTKKGLVIIQYQKRDYRPIYRFVDDTSGEMTTLDEGKWKTLKERNAILGTPPPAAVKQMQPIYTEGLYCRGVELEEPVELPCGFSLLCLTLEWDDEKKRWTGLVRDMIDPQKTMNKSLSSALAFHISNAKGGVIFKPKAFDDPVLAQTKWAQPDAWIPASDDADLEADILQRKPSTMPPELPMFYSEAKKAMGSTSGVTPEMVGTATGQTPSNTADNRIQGSLIVLGDFFDNLNRHRRERAIVQLEFIREYWSQGQLIQVGGDMASQSIPLFKESLPDQRAYSLVLDDSIRHNPNLKAQIWDKMMQSGIIGVLAKSGFGQVLLALLKYSPFPSVVVNTIQKAVAANPPQPKQGKGKQDPPELIQANVGLKSAQARKAISQAREIDMRTGLAAPPFIVDAAAQGHQAQQDKIQTQNKHKIDMASALAKGMGVAGGFGGPA